jgi:hypothetical protein
MSKVFSLFRWLSLALAALAVAISLPIAGLARETSGPHIVLIIRHAEKPPEEEKSPNLSKEGFARAEALAKVVPANFPRPDFLIATKRSKNSDRPAETITPLSAVLHEPIEATVKDAAFAQVAHDVLTNPKYAGKVVLISWHHGKIPELAHALGAKDAPDHWSGQVFDRVWEITYDHGAATFKDLPEKALPGDSEK